jgi:cytochrome P450
MRQQVSCRAASDSAAEVRPRVTKIFGDSILNLHDGATHRQQRKIASPAFSELNNREAWAAATDIVMEWCNTTMAQADAEGLTNVTKVENVTNVMTLMVRLSSGLGHV